MNQDQVKNELLRLEKKAAGFTVTFSGKKSDKVDGLYKPETCEIILHNKNFINDNSLMYTAIHEFAHHLQFTKSDTTVLSRAHTNIFWDMLHRLLLSAEEMGIYTNVFRADGRFVELTKKLREKFINVEGDLMKEFGKLLLDAWSLCRETGASFDDYVDRELQLHRRSAKTLMSIFSRDIDTGIGFENMKTVASIKDDDRMMMAQKSFLNGHSPDMVKAEFMGRKKHDDSLEKLLSERTRIERSIERLTGELLKIEMKISGISG